MSPSCGALGVGWRRNQECYAPPPVSRDATTLEALAVGESAEVTAVEGPNRMAIRLLEMGFVPGTRVELVKTAPMGDPVELCLRGYHLSLRRAEAAHVRVVRR
ncbi:MAG: ferrous iron transport protein A [Deltaproteobacteria bacterium]|nr:ferrous iron transport protein A [Deltaproteobacteria bacterium]